MSQAYSVTINLPPQLQDLTETIVDSYLSLLKDKTYIQSYENCLDGKIHAHIGYLSDPQKSTSNETRKFKSCYSFQKKEFPNAIKHCAHDSWPTLVGYVSKETVTNTNIDPEIIAKYKEEYIKNKTKKVKNDILTCNQIADKFVEFIYSNEKLYYPRLEKNMSNWHESLVEKFYSTIPGQIKYNTLCRMKTEKLIQYARINFLPKFFI